MQHIAPEGPPAVPIASDVPDLFPDQPASMYAIEYVRRGLVPSAATSGTASCATRSPMFVSVTVAS